MLVAERLDTNMTFVRPKGRKHRCTNYAVKYATARGHLTKQKKRYVRILSPMVIKE